MVVVDTNILAYLLIAGDRTKEAQALYRRDADWKSEAFVLVEFSNDARFIAAAEKLGTKLVTEDAKLRQAAPKLTLSLADALTRG